MRESRKIEREREREREREDLIIFIAPYFVPR